MTTTGLAGVGMALLSLVSIPAAAHVMVAQQGSLNVVEDGGFFVASVSAKAFDGVDDDGDGGLSEVEFRKHYATIESQAEDAVGLDDALGDCALEGLLINRAHNHDDVNAPANQILIMGRFTLGDATSALTLRVGLFGDHHETLTMKVHRDGQTEELLFTKQHPVQTAFAARSVPWPGVVGLGVAAMLLLGVRLRQ